MCFRKKSKIKIKIKKSTDFPIYTKPQNTELPECNGAVEQGLHLIGRSYYLVDN